MKEKLGWNHNCYLKQGQHCHMFEWYTIHCWYHFNLYVISKNFKRVQMCPAVSKKAKSTSQKSVQIQASLLCLYGIIFLMYFGFFFKLIIYLSERNYLYNYIRGFKFQQILSKCNFLSILCLWVKLVIVQNTLTLKLNFA